MVSLAKPPARGPARSDDGPVPPSEGGDYFLVAAPLVSGLADSAAGAAGLAVSVGLAVSDFTGAAFSAGAGAAFSAGAGAAFSAGAGAAPVPEAGGVGAAGFSATGAAPGLAVTSPGLGCASASVGGGL